MTKDYTKTRDIGLLSLNNYYEPYLRRSTQPLQKYSTFAEVLNLCRSTQTLQKWPYLYSRGWWPRGARPGRRLDRAPRHTVRGARLVCGRCSAWPRWSGSLAVWRRRPHSSTSAISFFLTLGRLRTCTATRATLSVNNMTLVLALTIDQTLNLALSLTMRPSPSSSSRSSSSSSLTRRV